MGHLTRGGLGKPNMSRIKGRDTKPEKIVRSLLHKMGFRLHVRIPISPLILTSLINAC